MKIQTNTKTEIQNPVHLGQAPDPFAIKSTKVKFQTYQRSQMTQINLFRNVIPKLSPRPFLTDQSFIEIPGFFNS